jgi:hypothetical protein
MDQRMWTYREDDAAAAGLDLKGLAVEALDGGIGHVDSSNDEVNAAYLVVGTGPWIFGRTVVIPAGTVDRIDRDDRKVYVGLAKEQIKRSPEFVTGSLVDTEYRDVMGTYYGSMRVW